MLPVHLLSVSIPVNGRYYLVIAWAGTPEFSNHVILNLLNSTSVSERAIVLGYLPVVDACHPSATCLD